MSLAPSQAKFASVFSRETGLNPQVVGAWLLAEQSGSAAKYYEGKGYNNWLNIGNTKPEVSQRSSVWGNPESAAKASAEWMRGQGQIAQEYGKPASGITAILGSHGQVPHRQIQAIANSGWASSGYEHGNTLSQLLGQVGSIPTTGPGPLPGVARQGAIASVTGTPTFNAQGYQQAAQHAAGERAAASLFTGSEPGNSVLREALDKAGTVPDVASFSTGSTQVPGVGKTVASGTVSSGGSKVLGAAVGQLGTPYVWGGEEEHKGFDCSGLSQFAYKQAGISIPRTAEEQYKASTITNKATPGNLIFFSDGKEISHVEIVAGNGKMIGADHTGTNVRYEKLPKVGSKWGADTVVGIGTPR